MSLSGVTAFAPASVGLRVPCEVASGLGVDVLEEERSASSSSESSSQPTSSPAPEADAIAEIC